MFLAWRCTRPFFSVSPTLPRVGGGGGCLPFAKWRVPPSDGTPTPPGGWGCFGGFEGKGYIPGAKGAGKLPRC